MPPSRSTTWTPSPRQATDRLPRQQARNDASSRPRASGKDSIDPTVPTVLLVEDDATSMAILKAVVTSLKLHYVEALDGEAAYAHFIWGGRQTASGSRWSTGHCQKMSGNRTRQEIREAEGPGRPQESRCHVVMTTIRGDVESVLGQGTSAPTST